MSLDPELLRELPELTSISRTLQRSGTFSLVICLAPARIVLDHAEQVLRELPARARVVWRSIDGPDWPSRRAMLSDLNVERDSLGAQNVALVLGILDCDYPRLSEVAPDLWTVRTRVVRHTTAAPLPTLEPLPITSLPETMRPDPFVRLLLAMADHVDISSVPFVMPDVALEDIWRCPLVTIEGPVGSGRTTLLRHLQGALVEAGVPAGLDWLPALSHAWSHDALHRPLPLSTLCLEGGGDIWLLDGAGESRDDEHLFWLIADLLRGSGGIRSIILTAPPGWGAVESLHGLRLTLPEWSAEQRTRLSARWGSPAPPPRRHGSDDALIGRPLFIAFLGAQRASQEELAKEPDLQRRLLWSLIGAGEFSKDTAWEAGRVANLMQRLGQPLISTVDSGLTLGFSVRLLQHVAPRRYTVRFVHELLYRLLLEQRARIHSTQPLTITIRDEGGTETLHQPTSPTAQLLRAFLNARGPVPLGGAQAEALTELRQLLGEELVHVEGGRFWLELAPADVVEGW